ncbi:Protein transport protein SEC31 [Pleurostoma richardsiae]|uniref:Protein transport protein SEC31 n=1 Tax=Pleurostoma richardsiae TaxID=41990 RepID=A0AA38RGV5_9PEZI|nr:Protein transport protein SEC31 [Pleurostoma richardsiae]
MLDENLPTFLVKPSPESPHSSILYLTQNGSEPAPEYVFRRADPAANPAARNRYAAALTDPYSPDVVYGEVVIKPEWQQPTLSAAEIRAQNGVAAPPVPLVPDSFTVQLYNPDQTVRVRMVPGSITRTDSWEFEMPSQSFKVPSASELDREQQQQQQQQLSEPAPDLRPKVMFKWKRDGRLSKDMSCYEVGRSLGRHKSKEPDITVALFKTQARDRSAVTIYEPNLRRVDVEDRKGLEIVLVLGAEVIRELFLAPRQDVFNTAGGGTPAAAAASSGRRKDSRPTPPPAAAMSGALGIMPPPSGPTPPLTTVANHVPSSAPAAAAAGPAPTDIDAETKRLQAMVAREEREREKRDRKEQERIRKMLEQEEKEQRRREAEVAKETERLRKMYGVEGQELPSSSSAAAASGALHSSPPLPPRPQFGGPPVGYAAPPPQPPRPQAAGAGGGWFGPPPVPPPRPSSAGPAHVLSNWWNGPGGGWAPSPTPPPQQQQQPPYQGRPAKNGRKQSGSHLQSPYGNNALASVSGFFHRDREEERRKVQKKRSVQW